MKDSKRIQKLVPKGEHLIERYAKAEGEETGWFVAQKQDSTYVMYQVVDDKAVRCGKGKGSDNPKELEKYVPWCVKLNNANA